MNKLIAVLMLCLLSGCKGPTPKSVVMLKGNGYSCTGFELQAPSGRDYLVTAGHCSVLEDAQGSITVVTEDGATLQRKAIAMDDKSDTLLLEGVPSISPLELAKDDNVGELIHVLGHGYSLPLWTVYGAIIGEIPVPSSQDPLVSWTETACSAAAAPGHSGSPVLDQDDRVIGVLSVGNGQVSGFVRIQDLKDFLKGY